MTHVRRIWPLVFCCLMLSAVPGNAKDQCCVVLCETTPASCHHWNTFFLWANAKCSALGIAKHCNAVAHVGDCSDNRSCTPENTHHSPPTRVGQPCKTDLDCEGPGRCAQLVLKKKQCVTPCETASDCERGQRCTQPAGTTFKRCK